MAFELNTVPPLKPGESETMVDLMQKMEAIDAALAEVQTDRAQHEGDWNKKTTFLNQQKDDIKQAIRAIRTVSVKEA